MPNGDDTTTVNLKDGTVLHLKGKLSSEQVQQKVSEFRQANPPRKSNLTPATMSAAPSAGSRLWSAFKRGGPVELGTEAGNITAEKAKQIQTKVPGTGKSVGEAFQGVQDYSRLLETSLGITGGAGLLPPEKAAQSAVEGASNLIKKIPTVSKASESFKSMEKLAQHVDIDPQSPFKIADSALKNTKSEVLERFYDRLTRPGATRLTYKEARGFLLDAASEMKSALPSARGALSDFMQSINAEIEKGVSGIGKLEEYQALSKQWKSAKEIEKAYNVVKDLALKKIIPYGLLPYFAARLGIKTAQGISQAP